MRDNGDPADPPNPTADDGNDGPPAPRVDVVEEASKESFPASDPPSWSPLRMGPPFDSADETGRDRR